MADTLNNIDVSFNRADRTVTLTRDGRALEIQLFDAADVARLAAIADRMCKQKCRARKQRIR